MFYDDCFQPFQAAVPAVCSPLTWMSNAPPVAHPAVPGRAAIGLSAPPIPGIILAYNSVFSYFDK